MLASKSHGKSGGNNGREATEPQDETKCFCCLFLIGPTNGISSSMTGRHIGVQDAKD